MAAKPKKPVYEMNPEELKELLQPVTYDVLQKKWEKNGYITYFDENLCESSNIMVHEFKDHRELVRIDDNGKATLIKKIDDEHNRQPSAIHYRRT